MGCILETKPFRTLSHATKVGRLNFQSSGDDDDKRQLIKTPTEQLNWTSKKTTLRKSHRPTGRISRRSSMQEKREVERNFSREAPEE
ncbi:hypothetical protein TNCV_4695401 [Trichonephila clavipes]|nr:hypothetical protein TNCV_4695401 [Trichonephila clavipes]